MDKYIKIPKTVVQLANEIKRSCDAYWNRELDENELRELVFAWSRNSKLLQDNDINRSIKKIVGQKRVDLINKMLDGYQRII